jgi:iron complex transport system substrate-binding protein
MIARRAVFAALPALALLPTAAGQPARRRIVSAGTDVTEILFALGLGSEVVAVDSTSLFPVEATRLPQIGYLRSLAAEGVLSLRPTDLVASGDVGPASTVAQLRAAGVSVRVLPSSRSSADVQARIAALGEAFAVTTRARALGAGLAARMSQVSREVAGMGGAPRVLFVIAINTGSPSAAGRGTAADAMIALAGARNPITGFEGFRPLSPEAAAMAQPDVVLLMQHTLDAAGGLDAVARSPAIALTPAGRARRIRVIDGAFTLGFGPRLPEAVRDLARLVRL